MKTRNSLVSNSSSSSFIVAYKLGEKCKCCGRSDPDLKQALENRSSYNSDNEVYATGKDEVIKHMKTGYDGDPDEMKELFEEIEKLDDSYTVIYFSVSNHDFDFIEQIKSTSKVLYRGEY